MNIRSISGAIGLVFLATVLHAQLPLDGIHYPAGLDNIRSTIAPQPGFYFRDDNLFYYGTADIPSDYKTYEYLQAPRLGWWSKNTLLGANYGADVMVPIISRQANYNGTVLDVAGRLQINHLYQNNFGLGDVLIEPLLLHCNLKSFDLLIGAGVWAPTGQYDKKNMANLGDGKWSPMTTLGVAWHPDQNTNWSLGILNRFEFNCQQPGIQFKTDPAGRSLAFPADVNCSTYTLEWEISRNFLEDFAAGIFGYYQKQFTHQGSDSIPFTDSKVISIGPEISADIKRWGLFVSLRYAYEFSAYNRPQGDMVTLSIIKRF